MRVVVVHNSRAGKTRHDRESLVRLIGGAGHEAKYFPLNDVAWKAALDGADAVAAAGGDGTVEEVARAVAGRSLPIAVLPLGTANNISSALGQADLSFEQLVAGWAGARRQPFDVGIARGPWGARRFLEGVGAGLLADSMADIKAGKADHIRRASDAESRMAAALGFFQRTLGRMAATRFDLSVDGRDLSGDYLLLEVLNFGVAGPDLRLAPHADPSDGLLDVVIAEERHRRDLADFLSASGMGPLRAPALPVYQGRHLTLSCGSCNLHLDDKVWPGQQPGAAPLAIDLDLEANALTFLVPGAPAVLPSV
jgi:diacylglycerol kinase (ATP)